MMSTMQQDTDSAASSSSVKNTQEISNFEISISNGLYWISYEDNQYPIIITTYQFKRLFEIEGLPIEDFTGEEPASFNKAILLRRNVSFGGNLFDEEGDDMTPQKCWVKENPQLDPVNP